MPATRRLTVLLAAVLLPILVVALPLQGQFAPAPGQPDEPLPPAPGEQPRDDEPRLQQRLIEVDREAGEVRVLSQAIVVDMPLEFFCVVAGTMDHETVLRTAARPSDVHAALVSLGLEPGSPVRFVPESKTWLPPTGPPIRIYAEWEVEGERKRVRAGELIRNIETGRPMPDRPFVFVGSQTLPDGTYAADITGQLVALVNFDHSVIDVPRLASDANELLEWEVNAEAMPREGTPVLMILKPIVADRPQVDPDEVPAEVPDVADQPAVVGRATMVVGIDRAGEIRIDQEPAALVQVGPRAAERMREAPLRVRLSPERGAPVNVVGRVLGELVQEGVTEVRFSPPPTDRVEEEPRGEPLEVRVSDGGRMVTLADGEDVEGRALLLGRFVEEAERMAGDEENLHRPVTVRPAPEARDLVAVDLAAPAAALHALGFRHVTVLEPAGPAPHPDDAAGAAQGHRPGEGPRGDVRPDEARLAELRRQWEQQVLPQADALQEAARLHYEVMQAYQREINRLIDEAERLRREMEELQERYNELTTPQPTRREG